MLPDLPLDVRQSVAMRRVRVNRGWSPLVWVGGGLVSFALIAGLWVARGGWEPEPAAQRGPVRLAQMSAAAGVPADVGTAPLEAVAALGRLEPKRGVFHIAGPPRPVVVIDQMLVEEGDRVTRGQVLAVLSGILLHQADLTRFQAELAHAERELQRRENLRRGAAASESAFEEAQLRRDVARSELARAEAELELSRVRAPVDGQVLDIHARAGERVEAEGILDLGETASMYAIAEVYETDIGRVREGQRAQIRSPTLPHALQGSVERIGLKIGKKDVLATDPVEDADARIVEVEIKLDDPGPAARLTYLRVDVWLEP